MGMKASSLFMLILAAALYAVEPEWVSIALRLTGESSAVRERSIEQLHLKVTASNEFMVKFYEKLGFERGELEVNAVKIDGEYYDWLAMQLSIQDYLDSQRKLKRSSETQKLG